MSKILHVFSDSPYTEMFIKFIDKHFDMSEHIFIILCSSEKCKFLGFYKKYENCYVTYQKNIYFVHKKLFRESKKIIIHQLNKPQLMLSLMIFYPNAFKKMTWVIWGGDLYFYKYKSNSIKDKIFELLRKKTIARIPTIVAYIKGDYEKLVEIYDSKANYIKAKYPSPIDVNLIKRLPLKKQDSDRCTTIMVGNSADASNEHIEALEILQKYKNENIKIVLILSYGGTEEYIKKVQEKGKNIFGDKCKVILDYMNFQEYLGFINSIDICLFNHKRQQGLGNQMVLFALHKKVYVNSMTTPFRYYSDLGMDIYKTESIATIAFKEFIGQSKEKVLLNRTLILEDISEETVKQEWRNVFK